MNSKSNAAKVTSLTATGLRAFFEGEIAAGCTRLGIRSRKDLLIEAKFYPSIEDEPEVYQLVPAPFVARARAVELLDYLACLSHHAVEEDLALIDECIAELRELQPTAATEIPESVTRKLKGAA
jgi:hypothetical protein